MTKETQLENVGFEHPVRRDRMLTHRRVALTQLIATIALVFSILIAAMAVSFGIARAQAGAKPGAWSAPMAQGRTAPR